MTDSDWGDLDQIPQKRQAPKLLFCGLGCFVPILLLSFAAFRLKGCVQEISDPEVQWEALRELVDYDHRPEGWEMELGFQSGWLGAGMFVLSYQVEGIGRAATFLQVPVEALDGWSMFDTDLEGVSPWVPPGEEEPLEFLEAQGRLLRVVLFDPDSNPNSWGDSGAGGGIKLDLGYEGPVLAIDLTSEGAERHIILTLAGPSEEPVQLAEVVRFLEPFHVGSER